MPQLFKFVKSIAAFPNQTDATKSFGHITATTCRVTSSFSFTALTPAYAMLPGTVLLQQQSGSGNEHKVNMILKPDANSDIRLPVKYIIYRGLFLDDFLTAVTVADPATDVKTTGLEILDKMKLIQDTRTTDPISVEALFGYDLNPSASLSIDDFFYKDLPVSSQLFHIDAGIHIGNYASGEGGIEILLENPEYFHKVSMAKEPFYQLSASGGADEIKWTKDLIRHFVDPAAFYGLHYDLTDGIGYVDSGGTAQTATTKALVYTELIEIFKSANRVYLDIRNQNGYSYNYYGDYVGSSGPDITKELKIAATIPGLTAVEYYTNDWALYYYEPTASTTLEENTFYIQLRVNQNEKPLLAGYGAMLPQATGPVADQRIKFIDEKILITGSNPEFTQPIEIKVPNRLLSSDDKQVATILRLDYIKQVRPNDGTDVFPQNAGTDHLFGPITAKIPWDSEDGTQWMSAYHSRYYDGLSQGYAIGSREIALATGAINIALRTITVNSLIQEQINEKIQIKNSTTATNVGTYTILNVQLDTVNSKTIITVDENIPGLFQAGDKLAFETEVFVYIDKVNSCLIAKGIDLTGNPSYQTSAKIKLYGIYTTDTLTRFAITSFAFVSGDTRLGFSASSFKEVGFGALMETGMVVETDLANIPPNDNDNIIFYAVPQYYFQNTGTQSTTFFNYRGGTNYSESFIDTVKKTAKNFDVIKTSLHPTVSTTLTLMSYNPTVKIKENIQFLGIKREEFDVLQSAASTQLSPYHLQMCKLVLQGNRKRDADYEPYYEYNLVISGLNSSGLYAETTSFVKVYSRDGLIFTSEKFAQIGLVPDALLDEKLDKLLDINHMSAVDMPHPLLSVDKHGTTNKNEEQAHIDAWKQDLPDKGKLRKLYLLDGSTGTEPTRVLTGPVNTLPIDLRNELNALAVLTPNPPVSDIEDIIKQKASDLFVLAKQRIQEENQPYSNKDGLLYITRLVMQLVIRNHPVIRKSAETNLHYEEILEFYSRGFEGPSKADFTAYPTGLKRILITGFDPFSAGLDFEDYLTNASGNIALAMDGVLLPNDLDVDEAVVRSMIFPTRWADFDSGWVERFIKPFLLLPPGDPNRPDMVITYSYGIHYGSFTPVTDYEDHNHNWHLDRFAANHRSGGFDNLYPGHLSPFTPKILFPLAPADRELSYIESKLPYEELDNGSDQVELPYNRIVINHGPFAGGTGLIDASGKVMQGTTPFFTFKIWGTKNITNVKEEISGIYDPFHLTTSAHSHFHKASFIYAKVYKYDGTFEAEGIYSGSNMVPNFTQPILLKQIFKTGRRNFMGTIIFDESKTVTILALVLDSNELKFRTVGNSEYVPLPTWSNYEDTTLEGSGLSDPTGYHDIYLEAVIGSGGDYMSNEIHYRVSYMRKKTGTTIPTGHVHVGFHKKDFGGLDPDVRVNMLKDVHIMIKKFNGISV